MGDLSLLHFEDWFRFERRWPDAAAFLRARMLNRELEYLSKQEILNHWQQARKAELLAWATNERALCSIIERGQTNAGI